MSTNYSLSNVFFSKVQQRILALLYGQPYRSYNTNEIIRLSHSGTGAVQRELEKLTMAGVLTMSPMGNQKHYRANEGMPLFSELRSIVLKTFGLTDAIKQTLFPISSKIQIAFIYGSVAKQEDIASSDIDLMILGDNITYADLFNLLPAAEALLSRKINPTFYSAAEWQQKKGKANNFLNQVIKQPKIFIIGTEDELTEFG